MNKKVQLLVLAVLSAMLVSPVLAPITASSDIKALYIQDRAYAHVQTLVSFGSRVAGGPGEKAAAQYIATQMWSYGLNVEIQEFPILYFEDFGSTLEVLVPHPLPLSPNTLSYSPPGEFTAEIVNCGLGYPLDFPPAMAGKIALIQRGIITFREKVQNAAFVGAIAAIIYNNKPGNFLGTLSIITGIPAVSISQEEGNLLLNLLASGPVTVHLRVNTVAYPSTSQNVIGTLKGIVPEQGIVYIGAHYDSVSAGPGANDDASGVAALLEAARVLSMKGHVTKATLKFIAFGAEETGLDGSYNYVEANYGEVTTKGIGMINLDIIAVGDTFLIGNIGLSDSSLKDYAGEKATAMNMVWQPFTAQASSDHTYFEQAGVPAVYLHQSPDPWTHTSQDTLDKINAATLEANGELATAIMYDWAKNPIHRLKMTLHFEKVYVYHDKLCTRQ